MLVFQNKEMAAMMVYQANPSISEAPMILEVMNAIGNLKNSTGFKSLTSQ